MKKGLFLFSVFVLSLIGTSCATTRVTHVNDQRRGLLMLEGENVYKNQGFYKSKQTAKRHKKNKQYNTRKPENKNPGKKFHNFN